jgi:ABC-type bacteriocin/lantibiotic exporter with double-glycine peptidase domain
MPMGMNTVVAEGINTLSGGQRQRIMIARAVARRPRILLFDEATSALDNQSQAIVSTSLGNLNVTRIVIAHRLSTVRQADRIIVLVDGKVVQTGNFKELSNTPGTFASFAQRQLL